MQVDAVTWLQKEFADRRARNPSYSERAFARAIGLSPAFLNHVLQRKKNLGPDRAVAVAQRLNWSDLKIAEFTQAVKLQNGKIPGGHSVPYENFQEMSDWYYFAIVEAAEFASIKGPADLQDLFGLSANEAKFALDTLVRAGLLQKKGGTFERKYSEYDTPAMSSGSIRKFHRQSLEKALRAVDEQPPQSRDLRTLTMTFDATRIDEVRADLARMMKTIERKYSSGKKNSVYQLNTAFHRLDKESK